MNRTGPGRLAAYDAAIGDRRKTYGELKQAAAGVLFLRNKLGAEQLERRVKLARAFEEIRRAVRAEDDETSLALLNYRQLLRGEVERVEDELCQLREQASEAKRHLALLNAEIRELERARSRTHADIRYARALRRRTLN